MQKAHCIHKRGNLKLLKRIILNYIRFHTNQEDNTDTKNKKYIQDNVY